jgi:hypothetical protein
MSTRRSIEQDGPAMETQLLDIVLGVAFSPDRRPLVAADNRVWLWGL